MGWECNILSIQFMSNQITFIICYFRSYDNLIPIWYYFLTPIIAQSLDELHDIVCIAIRKGKYQNLFTDFVPLHCLFQVFFSLPPLIFDVKSLPRLRLEMNQTTLWVGHFKTISCHFFTNYIKNFHKTKVLTNILRY